MAQQKIKLLADYGSKAMRVLDAVTPLNGAGLPGVNAKFKGQIYINDTTKKAYIAVAVDSATPGDDWEAIAFQA